MDSPLAKIELINHKDYPAVTDTKIEAYIIVNGKEQKVALVVKTSKYQKAKNGHTENEFIIGKVREQLSKIDTTPKDMEHKGILKATSQDNEILYATPPKSSGSNKVLKTIGKHNALISACETGRVDDVKLLLADKSVNPSFMKNEAIMTACRKEHIDVVKLLLTESRVNATLTPNDIEELETLLIKDK
jgi:hypothetical protein